MESKALTDVWEWKDKIYEETKEMSIKKIIERSKKELEELMREYRITLPVLEKTFHMVS